MPSVEQAIEDTQLLLAKSEQDEAMLKSDLLSEQEELSDLEAKILTQKLLLAELESKVIIQEQAIVEARARLEATDFDGQQAQYVANLQNLTARFETLKGLRIPILNSPYQIKKGDEGIRVWALQRALNSVGYDLLENATFKEGTRQAVSSWQSSQGLGADGVFGPKSSEVLAEQLDAATALEGIPLGLVRGIVKSESNSWIVAVNTLSPGGVDCGYIQRRVYEADYEKQDVIRRAFDSEYQLGLLADQLIDRKNAYRSGAAVSSDKFAWQLAALHHNWQYGASTLSKTPIASLPANWTTPKLANDPDPSKRWPANVGAKWPDDGTLVNTWLGWAQFYALGSSAHNHVGNVVRYVTDWS